MSPVSCSGDDHGLLLEAASGAAVVVPSLACRNASADVDRVCLRKEDRGVVLADGPRRFVGFRDPFRPGGAENVPPPASKIYRETDGKGLGVWGDRVLFYVFYSLMLRCVLLLVWLR